MKEIIKFYTCSYIRGLGNPTLILVGQEYKNAIICQKFILIQNPVSEKFSSIIRTTKIEKNGVEDLSLENFVNDYGLEYAKDDLYHRAIEINNYRNINPFRLVECRKPNLLFIKDIPIEKINLVIDKSISTSLSKMVGLFRNSNFTGM